MAQMIAVLGTTFPRLNAGFGLKTLALAFAVRAERKALAQLDPRLLQDIGVDKAAAHAESTRPIWDVTVGRL
ncbi:MAG: DUF1127 domain-containing protein [Planktomarina sp.]